MKKLIRRRKQGQGMTEYIIIVAVIAILSIAAVTAFGEQIRALFKGSGEALANPGSDISIENRMDDHGNIVERALDGNG